MPTYRIRDWESVYETAETRKLENLRWAPIPNKHDGLGFRRLISQRNRAELFAAWILLVQVASKGRRGQRGLIARDGRALSADDLELMTGFPAACFTQALTFFSDPKQGWLVTDSSVDASAPEASAAGAQPSGSPSWPAPSSEFPLASPARPADSAGTPAASPAEGKEEKEGKEGKHRAAAPPLVLPFPSEEFRTAWQLFDKHRRELKKPLTPASIQASLRKLAAMGERRAIRCIEHSVANGWQGLFEPEAGNVSATSSAPLQPIREPIGWKNYINHTYPEAIYAAGGSSEAHRWEDLPREYQLKFAKEIRNQN